jgi:predicted porin
VVDASISGYSSTSRDLKSTVLPNAFGVPLTRTKAASRSAASALANSGYNSSRLGFRGTEDLGGGLAASFWLEAPISNDDGATGVATFKRRSTVSLSGAFGEAPPGS